MRRFCEFTETWVVTQRDMKCHIKSHWGLQKNMIASFSFALTAHVTQWSNYLTQRAEILSRQSNSTPPRAKNTVKELSVVSVVPKSTESKLKQVGFTVSSLFFQRLARCSRQFTPNGSNFAQHFTAADYIPCEQSLLRFSRKIEGDSARWVLNTLRQKKWSHEEGLDRYLGTFIRKLAKLLT